MNNGKPKYVWFVGLYYKIIRGSTAIDIVGFEVLTAVSTKMTVFWVVAPCTRLHGATIQKTAIFAIDIICSSIKKK
jgi:hypothetical protein